MSKIEKEIALESNNANVREIELPDPYLVSFTEDDPENPKNWAVRKKWIITFVLSSTTFTRILVSTIMAPGLTTIAHDLHTTNTEAVMAMSVYLLATAFGPLVIAPLSELYGRAPVLHVTNVWFLVWNLVCGFAQNKGTLIAARFLAGFGASAAYSLSGGVLGDIWRPEQRGQSLSLYYLIPLFAAAIGPIVGGLIVGHTTWRWMFWSTTIFQVVATLSAVMAYHETYPAILLQKRAVRVRKETGNEAYHTAIEKLDQGRSMGVVLLRSLLRPARLLLFHPIVQIQACLSGFSYGLTYFVISTYSDLFTSRYHESVTISGLHYISMCLGEVVGAQVAGPLMDVVYRRLKAKANGTGIPEYRLPLTIPFAFLTPFGLLLYGWAAQRQLFWLVVDIGAAVLNFGMQVFGTVLQAYVIDSYPDHAASASAAVQVLRSLTAFGFPLFAPSMYAKLGYGWGNTLLALVALIIQIPAVVLIWKYGPRLREIARSSH